jgi:hypothetical protein
MILQKKRYLLYVFAISIFLIFCHERNVAETHQNVLQKNSRIIHPPIDSHILQEESNHIYSKAINEKLRDFIERTKPEKLHDTSFYSPNCTTHIIYNVPEIAHGPISCEWNSDSVVIVIFEINDTTLRKTTYLDHQPESFLDGYIYVQTAVKNKFKRMYIGRVDETAGRPVIESVFLANADKDPQKELFLFVSSEQRHYDYNGIDYFIFAYDNLESNTMDTLVYLNEISDSLYPGGDDVMRADGSIRHSRFHNAIEIKKELKRMGY